MTNSTDIENIPKILGSLTGVSVIDGGAEFAIGDILDISGNGRSGKARVVNTISGDGKVNFKLISPGSGYSKTTIPIIYPRVTLTLSSGNNNISSGQLLYQADNLANGIVYTNSTNEVVIKEISSGFTIGTWNVADRAAGILTAGTPQASSSAAWTGTGGFGAEVKQELESGSFTPAEVGEITTIVKLAINDNVYVSPQIFSTSAKQWLSGSGRFINESAGGGGGGLAANPLGGFIG